MISDGGWVAFEGARPIKCDLFLHALGFENRSLEFLRRDLVDAHSVVSFFFDTPGVLSYDENALICRQRGTTMVAAKDNARHTIQNLLDASGKKKVSVVLDISSLNRRLIAEALLQLCLLKDRIGSLKLVYTPQKFVEPEYGFNKVGHARAISPELTAFDSDPDKPIALMLGLGFEYGLGLGLIDLIEPERTVCFRASGFDPRYEEAVKKANFDYDFSTANLIVQSYTLIDPVAAYSGLNSIAFGLLSSHRIEIVPLGPKLFAAFAILLSLTFFGQVTVLRVPSNVTNPRDAFARDGFIVAEVKLDQLGDISTVYSNIEDGSITYA